MKVPNKNIISGSDGKSGKEKKQESESPLQKILFSKTIWYALIRRLLFIDLYIIIIFTQKVDQFTKRSIYIHPSRAGDSTINIHP